MHTRSNRWITVTPSQYPWEREALEHLRQALPDHEPYRVWSNFELTADDGSINEIDALVLTPMGLFLVEIKSQRGALSGDGGTWRWRFEGRQTTRDNPRLLTNRKAKRLKSRLDRSKAARKQKLPFVEAVVFLSATDLETGGLDAAGRQGVLVRRRDADRGTPIAGLEPLWDYAPRRGPKLGAATARQLERAMAEIGIRRSQSLSQVGDYSLEELIEEGTGWQDWRVRHRGLGLRRRLRLYHTRAAEGSPTRDTLVRAAKREVLLLQGIEHAGIVKALEYTEHELGPAVIFEDHAGARRLDHWLAEHGAELTFDQRHYLLRQLVDILHFAHGRRLVHRGLSPHSVLVLDPEADEPRLAVMSWHAGTRTAGSRVTGQTAMRPTLHPHLLIEDAAGAYVAPEVRTHVEPDGVKADVFSLGALAYHLFAGRPPAADALELQQRLLADDGLDLSAAVDGVSTTLAWLVADATQPNPERRFHDTDDLLSLLDDLEEDLTSPETPTVDPERLAKGDTLPGGLEVLARLGQGSTAIAFLVRRGEDEREQVLKLARSPEKNPLLDDEAEVLDRLRHQGILELYEKVRIGDHAGLLMARAGKETLAERLRLEGRLSLDFLERFGEDLLQIVQWLEEQGIPHRDIKPENLGVRAVGKNKVLHLVLFDFSLARAPADRCELGTPPYLDPFLRRPDRGRWDSAAERFAAAMTLHEMATGQLPTWGDGEGDALFAKQEVALDAESFVPAVRQGLTDFFRRALWRDAAERFDHAEQMLRAWRRLFLEAERPTLPTPHPGDEDRDAPAEAWAEVTLDTQVVELGLSSRAFHALETLGVGDVRALLRTPLGQVGRMRGVGAKTRHELLETVAALRPRFPEVTGTAPPPATPPPADGEMAEPPAGSEPAEPPADSEPAAPDGAPPQAVDRVAELLIPRPRRGAEGHRERALRLFLGLETAPGLPGRPNQSAVAQALGLTRQRVSQILEQARRRWVKTPALTAVRDDIAGLLALRGAVMGEVEVAEALLAARGARAGGAARQRAAAAVARAAGEAEGELAEPRWLLRRNDDAVALARRAAAEDEQPAQALAAWGLRLGRAADRLATLDPLPAPATALERLLEVPPPAGTVPLPAPRLVRLAAACSAGAAVSSRAELYPRGLPAARALTLAAGVAHGVSRITAEELRQRVRVRYPEAEPLPGRPALDKLLRDAGIELAWRPDEDCYVAPDRFQLLSSTGTYSRVSRTPRPAPPAETLAAEECERRLRRAAEPGAWLVLRTLPQLAQRAAECLTERFALTHLSGDRLLLDALRETAEAARVDWDVVLAADAAAPESRDGRNLRRLVERALPAVEQRLLAGAGTVLLTEPGLLGRYDRLDLLEGLRERLARPEPQRTLAGLWTLVPSDEQSEAPRLHGRAIPVLGPGDQTWLPESWVNGAHLTKAGA